MEDYWFHEGKLPSAYRLNFEQSLFNTEAYRSLQASDNWVSFYLLNQQEFLVEAQIHFYVKDADAKSIIQSPFGGIECSSKLNNNKALFNFIERFCGKLKDVGCKTITIVCRPILYSSGQQSLIGTFLQNLGFRVSASEIASVISVTSKPFAEIIHPRKKRKLVQSLSAHLEFRSLTYESLAEVYKFIEQHRMEKRYLMSASLSHLQKSGQHLPDRYAVFGIFHNGSMVAASVCVRVTTTILYHFISDHVRKIGEARPSLVLMKGIYEYCQQNNIDLFDLGTSAVNGLPNFKLIKFKTELGGVPTQKLTYTKNLS